jgi:subtilisin
MGSKSLRKGLVILIVFAMLFAMGVVNLSTAQTLPGSEDTTFSSANEKVDVLIGFYHAPGSSEQALVRSHGGDISRQFKIVDVIAATMTQQAADALALNSRVRYVEPNGPVYAIGQTVPWGIDRVFGSESYSFDTWSTTKGGGISVAILDTGIDQNHEDLPGLLGGVNTVDSTDWGSDGNSHGTHVAGTVAALDNNVGVVGVGTEIGLYAVKVLDDSGSGSVASVVAGIEWAVEQGIPVLNMSLGSTENSTTMEEACSAAYASGHLLVAAAGNSGNFMGRGENVIYPAKYESVIAVAASTSSDSRAFFSSTGPAVELIAPGNSILSTTPGNKYETKSGTSMASPHAAGAAALAWAANLGLTNVELRTILQNTAEDLGLSANHQGYGLVRADLAVKAVRELGPAPPVEEYTLSLSSSDGGSVTTPGEGAFTYEKETVVNLVAVAESGYKFVNWTGDINTIADVNSAETTITIDGDYYITANFEEKPPSTFYNLTTSSSDGGSVTTPGEGTFTYEEGTVVDLVAVAVNGYKFVNWSSDTGTIADFNASSTTITMNGDYTVTANFEEATAEGVVKVESITYTTNGGRLNDRHLNTTLLLLDDQNYPVSDASVSATLTCDDGSSWNYQGTTGSDGTVIFSLNNHGSGCYKTIVIAVGAEGLEWDGVTPPNSHTKK